MEVIGLLEANALVVEEEAQVIKKDVVEVVKTQVAAAAEQMVSKFTGDSSSLTRELVTLEQSRKEWEDGEYLRAANTQLYSLLARCQSLTLELSSTKCAIPARARNEAIQMFFKSRGYAYKPDTPLAAQIVRAVFGNVDRRRVSVYSIVVRAAIAQAIKPEGLAAWIINAGGVEEVRLAQSKNYIAASAKSTAVTTEYDKRSSIATIRDENLSRRANAEKVGEYCLLLAKQNPSGEFNIYEVVSQDAAVKAACVSLYSKVKPT